MIDAPEQVWVVSGGTMVQRVRARSARQAMRDAVLLFAHAHGSVAPGEIIEARPLLPPGRGDKAGYEREARYILAEQVCEELEAEGLLNREPPADPPAEPSPPDPLPLGTARPRRLANGREGSMPINPYLRGR